MSRYLVSRSSVVATWMLLGLALVFAPVMAAEDAARPADYAGMAALLEDPAAREALVRELRRLADESPAAAVDAASTPVLPELPHVSLSRRVAQATQAVAEGLAGELGEARIAVGAVRDLGAHLDARLVLREAVDLLAVVLVTLAVFHALRWVSTPLFRRIDRGSAPAQAVGSPLLRTSLALLLSIGLDLALLALAWVAGHIAALFVFGEVSGRMDTRQNLFLNAFIAVGAFRALIRVFFATRQDRLRLLPMSAESAAYWNAWLGRLSGFIGYGLLLVVPLVNELLGVEAGRVVTLLTMTLAFLYAWVIIRQNRDEVRRRMVAQAEQLDSGTGRVALLTLSRCWHLLALGYFAALGTVAMLRPTDALPFMVGATLQTVLAVSGGVFLSVVLTQVMRQRIHVPRETLRRFPLLEDRLNDAVPGVLRVLRLIIMVVILALVLDAWALFNLGAWVTSARGEAVLARLFTIGLILIIAQAVWIAVASWVEHRLNPDARRSAPTPRQRTLLGLFRSAFAAVLVTMTTMIVLAELGVNIGPLLAGAGVVGLAVGFGAQKLVQDVINGVFIQLEQSINAGDVVAVGGLTGVAERVTIRSLRLRDSAGAYHIIPFSTVDKVSNYVRDFGCHVGDYGVAYREDTDAVVAALQAAFDELVAEPAHREKVLGGLEVQGITAFGDSAVNVRVRFRTVAGAHWDMGRAYNRLVKRHFDAVGIEMPFPHVTVYFGEDRDGRAPPAHLRLTGEGLSLTRPEVDLGGRAPAD